MGTLLVRPPGHRRDVALRPAAVAMVWIGQDQPHETIAVPGVALGDGDVLVAVEMSTICDSDVRTARGDTNAPVPIVLGHECVGRVIAIGDEGATTVDGSPLRIGDRVVWSVTASCGRCDLCERGLSGRCLAPSRYGHDRIGAHGDLSGAFGSHVQVRAGTAIVRAPEFLPASVLAPASCATAIAWAAVARAARDHDLDGASVRVHGAGLVGVTAAAIAVEHGATVEVLDPDPVRAALAARFGGGRLGSDPDVVIEASGRAVAEAIDGVAPGGTVVLIGGPLAAEPVAVDAERIARRHVTVAGVQDSTGAELAEAVAFLAGYGRGYPFADAVGAVRPLTAIDDALQAASRSDAPLRVGLAPGR